YSFSPVEDGRLDISVNSSNDGFFTILENPKATSDTAPRLQFGVKQVTVKIPAFALASKSLSQGTTQVGSVNVWQPVEM
ncbi:hypothetical protein, partial [Streptococcus pneumoniae]|uniref:hypothetical protein n=1 Tax=Streptococcus pneumoniae TaxID=1313 RepID=UPI001E432806